MSCLNAAYMLILLMTANEARPEYLVACFESRNSCEIFERQIVRELIRASGNRVNVDSSNCKRAR